jgi:hypothetical protein
MSSNPYVVRTDAVLGFIRTGDLEPQIISVEKLGDDCVCSRLIQQLQNRYLKVLSTTPNNQATLATILNEIEQIQTIQTDLQHTEFTSYNVFKKASDKLHEALGKIPSVKRTNRVTDPAKAAVSGQDARPPPPPPEGELVFAGVKPARPPPPPGRKKDTPASAEVKTGRPADAAVVTPAAAAPAAQARPITDQNTNPQHDAQPLPPLGRKAKAVKSEPQPQKTQETQSNSTAQPQPDTQHKTKPNPLNVVPPPPPLGTLLPPPPPPPPPANYQPKTRAQTETTEDHTPQPNHRQTSKPAANSVSGGINMVEELQKRQKKNAEKRAAGGGLTIEEQQAQRRIEQQLIRESMETETSVLRAHATNDIIADALKKRRGGINGIKEDQDWSD